MAEQLHYRPPQARAQAPFNGAASDTELELERLQGRLAEINGLLDELYDSGVIRWLKDFSGALPQISTIALEAANTPQGQAGMRNLLVLAQQLGRVDPDRFERTMSAMNAGLDKAGEPPTDDTPYNPPGLTGVFKLLHDKELWASLSPLLAGAKAFANARAAQAETQTSADAGEAPDRDRRG